LRGRSRHPVGRKTNLKRNFGGGQIADGKPHLHIIVSNKAHGAFGGHLEEGCKVLSQVEIGIARFGGVAMTRKSSGGRASTLQKK